MKAIEFRAKIVNGIIEIPKKYRKLTNQLARIIILTEDSELEDLTQDKESIQTILRELKTRQVFTQIQDPIAWQRSLRDEWN